MTKVHKNNCQHHHHPHLQGIPPLQKFEPNVQNLIFFKQVGVIQPDVKGDARTFLSHREYPSSGAPDLETGRERGHDLEIRVERDYLKRKLACSSNF